MELKHLETFCMLAETLNFSQAADNLHFAQSTVTTHIQALENEFGVPLFNRMPRKITLTTHGQRLLPYAQRLLDMEQALGEAVRIDSDEPEGRLTIGASETALTYRLPPLLRAYRERYPNVDLKLRPLYYGDLVDAARKGTVDVAFIFEHPLKSKSLEVRPLVEENLVLVAAADHPLAAQEQVCAADLEGEPLLFTERNCGYRALFEHALTTAGMRPHIDLEFHSLEAIKQCIIAGLGLSLMPEVAIRRECDRGELVRLPWDGQSLSVWTQIIWAKQTYICHAMARFIDMSEELLAPQRVPAER